MKYSDRHHFISKIVIYGDGPLMVVTIDVYIWWHSFAVTISYYGEGQKMSL